MNVFIPRDFEQNAPVYVSIKAFWFSNAPVMGKWFIIKGSICLFGVRRPMENVCY
jgi:hypothetical protein